MQPERTVVLKVRRWGDRLALVLPTEVTSEEGIGAEDIVIVKVRKRRPVASLPARDS